MFIITNGSSVLAMSNEAKSIREYFVARKVALAKQYLPYRNSSYHITNWPNENSFIASQMRNYKVLEVSLDGLVDLSWEGLRALIAGSSDVSSMFFTIGEEETKVGEHITAQVVKKGLKSFGKTVVVDTRLKKGSYTVAPTPAEWKTMYDAMARIVCFVDSWGKITVSPSALDNYKMTPKMKKTPTINFVE